MVGVGQFVGLILLFIASVVDILACKSIPLALYSHMSR